MKKIRFLILALILIYNASCDLPEHYATPEPACNSENKDDLKEENQKILIAKLKDKQPEDYRYFFKTFEEIGSNTYMVINFRNDRTCFDIRVLVEKWDKLVGMKKTNGKSYPKELYDLKWEIKSINSVDVLIYKDMHRIID